MKQLTLPNGKQCFCLDRLTAQDTYREVYIDREYFRFGLSIPEDAIVFDVGANIGHFSRYVAERYPSSRIYGFEPVPQIFAVYSANVREYADRVFPYNLGLAEKEDEVTIEYFPRLCADSSIVPFEWKVKLGFYADHWEAFTQGSKIAGIEDAHWPLIRQAAIEVHQHIAGGEGLVGKFTGLLESKGFTVNTGEEFMAPGSDVFMLYAKREGES